MAADLTRITVNLLPVAYDAMVQTAERTKMSNTDTVNRALQVYGFINQKVKDGDQLIGKRPDGTLYEMVIL